VPVLTFGDVSAALNDLQQRDPRLARAAGAGDACEPPADSWVLDGTPTREALDALGFEGTSKGIARVQSENRAGWLEHARRNKSLVLQAVDQLPGRSAAVIGAGHAFDLPLRELAQRYDRLVLVDVDEKALEATGDRAFSDPGLKRKVELVTWDVTGMANRFVALARRIVDAASSAQRACDSLVELLSSFTFREPPGLLGRGASPSALASAPERETVDIVYSCMVLSQLATPLTQYAETLVVERFERSDEIASLDFRRALAAFTHRVQHAHVEALCKAAGAFVLSSDVSERYTRVGAAGSVEDASMDMPLIGAERLDELVPALLARPMAIAEWHWPRIEPTPHRRGSSLRVHGLVARTHAGGRG